MMINIKEKRGITLISMVLTVIVLLIIVGTISYSSKSSFETKKLEDLYSDIDALTDAVSVYYLKNKSLPVYYSNKTLTGKKIEYQPISFAEEDDDIYSYYIIDVTKLNNIVLNNKNNVPTRVETNPTTGEQKTICLFDSGSYSENITITHESDGTEIRTSDFDTALRAGMFVVNSSTHAVYYTKGVVVDDITHYTKTEDFSKIPTFSKIDKKRIEDDILDKDKTPPGYNDENVTIIFYANGGTDAPENMVASRANVNKPADSLEEKLNGGIDGIAASIPNKNGMKFLGWSNLKNPGKTPLYSYDATAQKNYKCKGTDIRFSQTQSNVIELYAVWEVDTNLTLYCYYPESTGGILPSTLDNKTYERTGKGDSVKNYLSIDIPTSGYLISWNWDANSTDEKSARYVGQSQTNQLTTGTSKYQTTEPGTIQIKGSFSNLNITLNMNNNIDPDGITAPVSDLVNIELKENEKVKTLDIYQINTVQKDKVGSKVNSRYKWLTGIDGKMQIPSNPTTFIPFGIQSPAGEANYDTNESSQYYLKNIVLFDKNKVNNSVVTGGQTCKLNDVVQITNENNNLYPGFGARNYAITNSSGGQKYYHESLQEAYNQAFELKYDKISVLRDVNSCSFAFSSWYDLNDRDDINWQIIDSNNVYYETVNSKLYVPAHDPSYAVACNMSSNVASYKVTLDCANYIIGRKGTINLKNNANVIIKANSSNCGIIFFNNNSTESVKLGNSSKLYIQNGVSVFSDNGAVIGLESASSLFLHKGKVININAQNPKSIYSNTATTSIYIGIKENANELYNNTTLSDGDIVISTEKGLPLMTYGKIYWKAGLLKTSDIVNKSGYNDVDADGRMKVINTKNTTINSCLYYDFSENKICAKLGARNWEFCDEDNGQVRTYYSDSLQDAHDCINLKQNVYNTRQTAKNYIKWVSPVANSGTKNSATITKKNITINFNSSGMSGTAYNNSLLTIKTKTNLSEKISDRIYLINLKTETTTGIKIDNSSVSFENIKIGLAASASSTNALDFKNSYIDMIISGANTLYTKGGGHALYNDQSKVVIQGKNGSSTEKLDIYTESEYNAIYNTGNKANLKINLNNLKLYTTANSTTANVMTNDNNAVFECSGNNAVIEVKNGSVGQVSAIYNVGTCNIYANVKSNATATDAYAIKNKKILNVYGKIEAPYGIMNSNIATAEIYLRDGANITATKRGINSKKGNLHILPNVAAQKYPSITTTANDSVAIIMSGGANLYLGNSSDSTIASTSYPLITSARNGIQASTSDKIYYYDGKIKAKNECLNTNAKNVCQILSGYTFRNGTDGAYNVVTLRQQN